MRNRRAVALVFASAFGCVGCRGSSTRGVTPEHLPDERALVTVRSALSGKVRWTAKVPGRCGRVSAAGESYLVINDQVLDRRTGRWMWHANGAVGVRGASTGTDGDVSPVVDGPTIIVMHRGALQGRDPRTGRMRWTRRQAWFAHSLMAVGPSTVVAARGGVPGAVTTAATAWDRATGKKRWSAEIPSGSIALTRTMVAVNGDALRGLDVNTGAPRWVAPLGSAPVAVGVDADVAVVGGADGIVAFDAVTGSRRWTAAGFDHFLVQPGSGVVTMSRNNEPTDELVDLKSGARRLKLDGLNSAILPVSATRVVRAGLGVYEGIRGDGRVVWTASKARGFASESDALVGKDLVTIPDHCER